MAYRSTRQRAVVAPRWLLTFFSFLVFAGLGLAAEKPPNILIILTDDQDRHMETVEHMPALNKYIVDHGTSHTNHYCTIALCCPSRATMWTGLQGHNHNVTDVAMPYGGYKKVVNQGINDNYLPIWMQDAGYNTYYAGKLWNGLSTANYNNPPVNGFTKSEFLLDPGTYVYYNASTTLNLEEPQFFPGLYSTDIIANRSYSFLQEALSEDKPFFLVAAPVAPHEDTSLGMPGGGRGNSGPPPPAVKYEDYFNDFTIPRTPDFNPDKPGGAAFYKDLPKQNQTVIDYNDEFQRRRLRALLSVDDMIKNLTQTLQAAGALKNTYVIFTTDNGFHLSQHRLYAGKNCGYETDVHIPFVIRGPGIPKGATNDAVTSHVDLAPTIFALAGIDQRPEFDGGIMPIGKLSSQFPVLNRQEHVNVEHWGLSVPSGLYGTYNGTDDRIYYNATFKSARIIGSDYSMYYSVWCNGDHEYYDMTSDPYQLDNLFIEPDLADQYTFQGRPFKKVITRFNALLMVLKSCKTDSCRQPWSALFPEGQVTDLAGSMDKQYDEFFKNQPQISFQQCALGYIIEDEGPQQWNVYEGNAAGFSLRDLSVNPLGSLGI